MAGVRKTKALDARLKMSRMTGGGRRRDATVIELRGVEVVADGVNLSDVLWQKTRSFSYPFFS